VPNLISTPYFVRRDTTRIYLGGMSMRFDGTDRRAHLSVSDGDPEISPAGDRAIVRAENNVYVLTMPPIANNPPAISVKSPASASVPVRRASLIGGEFLGWAPDGKSFHYSLGRSFFVYDLAAADSAIRDSTNVAARKDRPRADSVQADTAPRNRLTYEPPRYDVTITVPKDRPSGTIVLRGARVITMKGDEVVDDADLVVTNNRIVSIGKRGSASVLAGAHVVDVTGKTIIPGFVDIHWHGRLEDRQERDIHHSRLWYYWATLAWGTTTTRDPQTGSTDVLSYADVIETGDALGPRVYSTGPGLGFVGVNSLDEIRDVLRRYADFYDTKTIKEYAAGARKARQWVAIAARELKLTPTTEGYADLRKNITQLFDGYGGNEHAYPIHPLYKDLVQLHAESGTTYTPTLLTNYGGPWGENYFFQSLNVHDDPKVRRFVPHSLIDQKALRRSAWFSEDQFTLRQQAEQAAKIVAAGGRVGLGAHGQFHGLDAHWELWLIQSGGMPRHDALRVATIFGADAIGLGKDLGSLEPGKLADLQVLEKNPLDDIRHTNTIRYVMKNGRLYDGNTLDELWPRKIKRAPLWKWED
jgi:imidazolonepropionase-like amidohydrolase